MIVATKKLSAISVMTIGVVVYMKCEQGPGKSTRVLVVYATRRGRLYYERRSICREPYTSDYWRVDEQGVQVIWTATPWSGCNGVTTFPKDTGRRTLKYYVCIRWGWKVLILFLRRSWCLCTNELALVPVREVTCSRDLRFCQHKPSL